MIYDYGQSLNLCIIQTPVIYTLLYPDESTATCKKWNWETISYQQDISASNAIHKVASLISKTKKLF